MDKIKLLSDELKSILLLSKEDAIKRKTNKILLDGFFETLVNHYLVSDTISKNQNLENFFNLISSQELSNTIKKTKKTIVNNRDIAGTGCENPFTKETAAFVIDYSIVCLLETAREYTDRHFSDRHSIVCSDVLLLLLLRSNDNDSYIKLSFDSIESNYSFKLSEALSNIMKTNINEDVDLVDKFNSFIEDGVAPDSLSSKSEKSDDRISDMISSLMGSMKDSIEDGPSPADDDDDKKFEAYGENKAVCGKKIDETSTTPILDQFSTDMTKDALNGKYDPVIGRDELVKSIIEILCKRKKPNVCLVGLAGTGKSTIIERLAQMIVNEEVPINLIGKRICSLNLNDLVAGTKYRGEYEERLQKIIKEVCNHKEVIVYIDEIHNLVGSGSSDGSGDGANILKPYLARGEFQCIGSTTNEEYRKFIEKDSALNRRFTQVEVMEPSKEETINILNGIKQKYEEFHNVRYGKDVIEACVDWSDRYITDKNQPDKAIDIMDLTGSLVDLEFHGEVTDTVKKLREEINTAIENKIKTVENLDFETGQKFKDNEDKLREKLDKEISHKLPKKEWTAVKVEDVAKSVAKVSKVPIDKISQTDMGRLVEMKNELGKKVIGQDEAIEVIVNSIQKNILGLRDIHKPIASLLFCGPTGVGKTLICKEVASIFFGSENLVRIDGGTLKEESSVTSLIGAPPSYIGYDDPPKLLEVKRLPRCVLLIDEVEKMHSSIYDVFLNILDEGYTTLADGTRVDFTNCIIIFTGNIGSRALKNKSHIGFGDVTKSEIDSENDKIVKKAISNEFKPEFINRLSNIVVFHELHKEELDKIFDIEFKKIKEKLSKSRYSIKVSNSAKDFIVSKCIEGLGARELQRNIEKYVLGTVSAKMLEDTTIINFMVDTEIIDGVTVCTAGSEKKPEKKKSDKKVLEKTI